MIDLKTKIVAIIFVVLIGIIVYLFNRPEPEPVDVTKIVQEATYYKDRYNNTVAKLQQKELSEKQMRSLVDSMAKALKVKPKYIQGETRIDIRIDTQFVTKSIPVIIGKDTAYKVTKKDEWVDVEAVAGKDTSSIKLSVKDHLYITQVVKNPLIGRTKRELLIRNANPYSTTTSGYSFTLKEKQTLLTVGPYLGIDIKGKPSLGIAVQFPIIKVKR